MRKKPRRRVVRGPRKQAWEVEFHMAMEVVEAVVVDVLHKELEVVPTVEVEIGSELELAEEETVEAEIGSQLGEEAMVGVENCIRMVEVEVGSCKLEVVEVGSCKQVVVEVENCKLVVVEAMAMEAVSIEVVVVKVEVEKALHKGVGEEVVVRYREEVMGEVERGQEGEVMSRRKQVAEVVVMNRRVAEVEKETVEAEKVRVVVVESYKWEEVENTRVEEEVAAMVEGAESGNKEAVEEVGTL